jgi:BNR/Asp-box repeat
MFDAYVGTTDGVYRLRDEVLAPLGLKGERIWAIHAFADGGATVVLAGSYGNGLYRSVDGGQTWSRVEEGLTASAFRCIGPDPLDRGAILAGTEPARIFRSRDGGRTWRELDDIPRIEGHERWFLPYSPRAGALRNVFAPPGGSGRLLASVEVGGLLSSGDGGQTWTVGPVIEDEDIHYVTGHPSEPDLLYAALGYASLSRPRWRTDGGAQLGGVARTRDGGVTWRKLETDYTRATIVPPSRPDLLLAAPAPEVGKEGRIVVSADGGDSWEPASQGIDTPMPDMVELFVAAPDESIWAICSGGRLLRATAGEWRWRSALPAGADLTAQSVSFVAPEG